MPKRDGKSLTPKKGAPYNIFKQENDKKEKPKIRHSPGFFRDGFIFEQVADFKYEQGDLLDLQEQFYFNDWFYQPLPRCPWPLASQSIEFGAHAELWSEINKFIREHLFLPSDELYDVLTAWVIASWIRECFTVVPYVFFYGPVASGKTRGLEVLQRLSYRGILASNISGAALFRSCEEWHPTLFLDETEIYNQDTKVEVIGLLNSGYRKGQYAIRAKRSEHGMELEVFDVFGFKALAGTQSLIQTLESRSIMIRMMKNRAPIRKHIDEKKALELRNRLLGWRFDQLACEQSEPSERFEQFEHFTEDISLTFGDGRLNELFGCLLFVAGDNRENIIKHAKEMSEIRAFEEETSHEAEVVRILIDNEVEIENNFILTKRVRELFNESREENERWKSSSVGYILRRLGFVKKHVVKGNGWIVLPGRLKYLAQIYGIEIDSPTTVQTIQTVQPIQSVHVEAGPTSVENSPFSPEKPSQEGAPPPDSEGAHKAAIMLKGLRKLGEPKT